LGRFPDTTLVRFNSRARIPIMPSRLPIACSLDGDQARRRWQEWNILMDRRLSVDRSPQRLTVRFPTDDEVMPELIELVAAERQCNGFVSWELEDLGNEVVLTVRGDTEGVMAMAESFGV